MKNYTARGLCIVGCACTLFCVVMSPLFVQRAVEGGRSPSLKADYSVEGGPSPSLKADYYIGLARIAEAVGFSKKAGQWEGEALHIRQGQVGVRVTGLNEPETEDLKRHVTREVGGMSIVVWGIGKSEGDVRFVVDEKRADAVRESIRRWKTHQVEPKP